MVVEHRAFDFVHPNTIIWQYMSLCKFISLLRDRRLYFNRVDSFNDKFECTLTAIDKKIFRYTDDAKWYWERERKLHYISCWVESNYELALMWDTYGKDGVAIRTTVGDLIDGLAIDKEHHQYLARVKYIDGQLESSQEMGAPMNFLKIPMSKRKFYEQEREIRLLYTVEEANDKTGISFSIDLDCLIKEIRVHPNAPHFFLDVVNKELESANLNIDALFSEI